MTNAPGQAQAALLRLLVEAGQLSADSAREAEAAVAAKADGTSAAEWLAGNGVMSEEQFTRAVADRLKLPYVNLATVALDAAVTELVREELANRCRFVPLRVHDRIMVIATANPLDRDALRVIEFATGMRVHVEVATPTAIRDALAHTYHLGEALDEYLRGVPEGDDVPVADLDDEQADVKSLISGSKLPPVVKLFNLILLEGVRTAASDIHIEAGQSTVQVRYRIDGILEESFRLPKWVQDPLTARCKVLSKLDITERRVPQDGRIRIRYRGVMIDLRVSSLPTQFGEKITMRILDSSGAPTGLEGIGLSPRDLKCIRQAIGRPEGMVLVTGPTGSGKTTTLYGMLAEIISPTRNIVTIENPIEYQIRGINQVEINEKQGLTFAGTLRSILRQDPDVIMVGEIRDQETAEIALRAAQTGHLVLSTLHTNDVVSTVTRLIDIGIEPYMLASSLHAIVAQRLVRRVCKQCGEPDEPEAQTLRALQIEPGGNHQFRRGRGCPACRKSGYSGRAAVFEVMSVTPTLAKLIEAKAQESALRLQARQDGSRPLFADAAAKACTGITTIDEVVRVVDVPDEGSRCPSCSQTVEENFAICPHCGTPLHCKCSSCGMNLQKEWQICPYCGTATTRGAAPATVPPRTATRPMEVVAAVGQPGGRQLRALVVDDQPDFRRLISFTLEQSGLPISVEAVAGGAEALDLAEDNPPDLILLDIMMPDMDGFEVCQRLRSNVRTAFIPILMLTALDDSDSRARGFLAGTDDYISKPFARAELLARVRRLIERTYGSSFAPEPIAMPRSNGGDLAAPRVLDA